MTAEAFLEERKAAQGQAQEQMRAVQAELTETLKAVRQLSEQIEVLRKEMDTLKRERQQQQSRDSSRDVGPIA